MTPSAFRLVPYKSRFHSAILSATRYDLPGKWSLNLRHKGSVTTIKTTKKGGGECFCFPQKLSVAVPSYQSESLKSSLQVLPLEVEMADGGTTEVAVETVVIC